jgi:hypothetical protein
MVNRPWSMVIFGMYFFSFLYNKNHVKMKNLSIIVAVLFLAFASCKKEPTTTPKQSDEQNQTAYKGQGNAIPSTQAYYDSMLFNINLMEYPDHVAANLLAHNPGTNEIYAYADLDNAQPFFPIIDAVPGDGMNPLWLQQIIVFNSGFAPHQFYSDDQIDEAVDAGEITLTNSGELYRCSVTGHK